MKGIHVAVIGSLMGLVLHVSRRPVSVLGRERRIYSLKKVVEEDQRRRGEASECKE